MASQFNAAGEYTGKSGGTRQTIPITLHVLCRLDTALATNGDREVVCGNIGRDGGFQNHGFYIEVQRDFSATTIFRGFTLQGATASATVTSTVSVSTGTWYWVTLTASSSTNLDIQVQSTLTTSSPSAVVPAWTTDDFSEVGRFPRSGGLEFGGSIAHYAVYSTAISTTHRDNLYNSGSGGDPDADVTPVEWWIFSELSDTATEPAQISSPTNDMSQNVTPSFVTHPVSYGGGGGLSIPIAMHHYRHRIGA